MGHNKNWVLHIYVGRTKIKIKEVKKMFEVDNKPNKEISFKIRMTQAEKEILNNLSNSLKISSSEVLRTGLILLNDLNKNVFKVPLNQNLNDIHKEETTQSNLKKENE